MKIAITGATGFIGRPTAIRLATAGHAVTAIVRRSGAAADLPCKEWVWDADRDSAQALADALRSVDAVIHLAGEPISKSRWTPAVKQAILQSRVEGTQKLVQALTLLPEAERPQTLISGSAIGYYGSRAENILNEESSAGEGFLSEVVQAWEAEARKAEALGIRLALMRTGIVLGVGGGALEKMQAVVLGSGQQWMSWIHIEDIVRWIEFALSQPQARGVFNLTAPHPVTNREFTGQLARATGAIATLAAPGFAIRLGLGEMAVIALDSCRALPERTLALGFRFQFPQLTEALTDLFPAPLENKLLATQFVPYPIDQVFEFFSEAKNLETLTPPWLNFSIQQIKNANDGPALGEGSVIDYKLKIHGVPAHWRTLIEDWKPGQQFVDRQLQGPYTKWHHTHRFREVAGGTLVEDQVIYRLPVGKLGRLFGMWLVKADVEKIFSYRRKKIAEIFARKPHAHS